MGFPGGSLVKNLPAVQEMWANPWLGKIPWRRKWQPIPVLLGKSHRQRSLVAYSPWDHKRVSHDLATNQQQEETKKKALPGYRLILRRSPSILITLLLLSRFSRLQLCATPWMAAHQAPPSLGFSRQEYWSGLPFPSPIDNPTRYQIWS